ncbi:MAG TPA: response regulator transcription factor [Polyangia bacterium]|nr:response regulator transcription factor [Polyangia bacterium]
MKIALLDTSEVFRIGIWAALAAHRADVEKVLDCGRADTEAILAARPDVLLTGLGGDGSSGMMLTRRLKAAAPNLTIAVLANDAPINSVRHAVEAGASAYFVKSETVAQLMSGFDRMVVGEVVVPTGKSAGRAKTSSNDRQGLRSLSAREREIFDLVVWGASNKDVASRLTISVKTVETHRVHINGKLGSRSTADMVRLAWLWGALDERGSLEELCLHGAAQRPGSDRLAPP